MNGALAYLVYLAVGLLVVMSLLSNVDAMRTRIRTRPTVVTLAQ